MILKDETIGAIDGIDIIEFGDNDIIVSVLTNEQECCAGLGFATKGNPNIPQPAILPINGKVTTDAVPPEIMIIFSDQGQIDFVIQYLLNVKNDLARIQQAKEIEKAVEASWEDHSCIQNCDK